MPVRGFVVGVPSRRHITLALALPFIAVVAAGCRTFGAAAGAPDNRVTQAGGPGSFVRSTSDTRSTRLIELRDGLTKALAWRAALDLLLASNHTIDVRDESAGFVMTSWEAPVLRDGVPDLRYRTRVTLRFLGDEWRQLQVRTEANWRTRGDEWDVGFDQTLLDKVTGDLQSRLGKRSAATP